MDEQAQVETPSRAGRIGITLADLGTRIECLLSSDAPGAPTTYRATTFDRPPAPDEVIARVVGLVSALTSSQGVPLVSAGVAVWGRVDSSRGVVTDAHYGEAWADVPFTERLSRALGIPVRLTTEVRAAAHAEYLWGAGHGQSPLLYVSLGRTVASAILTHGEPLIGAHDDEGRLGHWQTGHAGPRCVCGAVGHLEPFVSAQSLVRLAIGLAADDSETLDAILRVTSGRAEALTVSQLVSLASQGVAPLQDLSRLP